MSAGTSIRNSGMISRPGSGEIGPTCTPEFAENCGIEEGRKYHLDMLNRHEKRAEKIHRYIPTLGIPWLWYETQMIEYHDKILRMIDEQNGGY